MARAVNQTIAWMAAFFLSLIVFGIGLTIVFSMKPKLREDSRAHAEHTSGHESAASDSEHLASPEHPAEKELEHAKPALEHADSHSKGGDDEDKEITPASLKAKAGEHGQDSKPHH